MPSATTAPCRFVSEGGHKQTPCARRRHSTASIPVTGARQESQRIGVAVVSRREAAFSAVLVSLLSTSEAQALGFKKDLTKKRRGFADSSLYSSLDNGLKVYDEVVGNGEEIVDGTRIEVHYDCRYRGLDVVSSRAARLLGGNRIIAEPLDFVAGQPIDTNRAGSDDRGGGGLFAGSSGPQPPPALSTAVIGMKKGGKRSVVVPPELGYGSKGMQEIPPDATFELVIEVLRIF